MPALIRKRCLLWDWTNTAHTPQSLEQLNFQGPISSLSNWNTWTPPELKNRLPFRPTVRQKAQLTGQDWDNVLASDQPIIHYLNEPERDGVSPAEAAQLWTKQMLPLRRDKAKKLVSPSCASDAAGDAWMDAFMGLVAGDPPDFLGVHYYGPEAEAAIKYIQGRHEKYPGLPIIVSEIASISRLEKEVFEFTARLANWMDETPWVFEYCFFGCMREVADGFVSPQAQLMKSDGTFTELMCKLMHEQPMKV